MTLTEILILVAVVNGASVADLLVAAETARNQGDWMPAGGGTEEVFTTRSGRRLLYCFQAASGAHAYLDVDTDLILSDEEALTYLGMS